MSQSEINTRIAIVTGASSGLGYELAQGLVRHGLPTCLVAKDPQRLAMAIKRMDATSGATMISQHVNVGVEEEVASIFNNLKRRNFQPYVLINAAGTGRFGDPDKVDRNTIDTVFEANLIGLILMSSYALREMRQGGTIVNIMSTAALIGREKEAVYCAAKWGARGFTEALKAATKGTTVSVIGVYPGGMNTPFWSADCGLTPNVAKFMSPKDVATKILDQILPEDTTVTTDLTINRRT